MTNQKIGSFIASLRKEQNLTQEQLAAQLGVSNRSISRWENGKTLPDYSLMPHLAAVLGVSFSELLTAERMDGNNRTEDCVRLALELAQQEKDGLRKSLNRYFGIGLTLVTCGSIFQEAAQVPLIFFLLCTALGVGFLFAGFWTNNRKSMGWNELLFILVTEDSLLRMKTAAEMLQFSRKYQSTHKKQHLQSFKKLAAALADDEYAVFTFIADSCTINENPGPWHICAALTNKRFLISGEAVRGARWTYIETEGYNRSSLKALHAAKGKLVLQLDRTTIKMDGQNMITVAEKLKNLCSF